MAASTACCVNIPDELSHTHTNFKVAKFCHTWKISNFSFCEQQIGQSLTSLSFPVRGEVENDTTKWCLTLYPKGCSQECREYLSFFVTLLAAKKSEVKATLTMGIVDAEGTIHMRDTSKKPLEFVINRTLGFNRFVPRDNLLDKTNGLMQDDNLVLFCEMKVLVDISNTEYFKAIQCRELKNHPLSKIGRLLETKKFSDVTIIARGNEFQAHKNILAAQSPVFSAMFEHDMDEKKLSRIEIIDIDHEVVKEMLLFLYTGKLDDIQERAVGLLAAADKYALEELKFICEEALCANLTIENAADTLILADLHSTDRLKPRVMSFICYHAADVMTTTGFKLMVQSHPDLIAEAFCQIALRKSGNTHEDSEPMWRLPRCLCNEDNCC